MLSHFFHAWERRLASVTKDRVVRPFDWGVDWLSSNSHELPPGERVERWVDEVMSDTDAFFAVTPATDYRFDPADAAKRERGEAGTFPSDREPDAVARSSSCRSGTRIARGTPAWRGCWRASVCRRYD